MASEKARQLIHDYAQARAAWLHGEGEPPRHDDFIAAIVAAEEEGRPGRGVWCSEHQQRWLEDCNDLPASEYRRCVRVDLIERLSVNP